MWIAVAVKGSRRQYITAITQLSTQIATRIVIMIKKLGNEKFWDFWDSKKKLVLCYGQKVTYRRKVLFTPSNPIQSQPLKTYGATSINDVLFIVYQKNWSKCLLKILLMLISILRDLTNSFLMVFIEFGTIHLPPKYVCMLLFLMFELL